MLLCTMLRTKFRASEFTGMRASGEPCCRQWWVQHPASWGMVSKASMLPLMSHWPLHSVICGFSHLECIKQPLMILNMSFEFVLTNGTFTERASKTRVEPRSQPSCEERPVSPATGSVLVVFHGSSTHRAGSFSEAKQGVHTCKPIEFGSGGKRVSPGSPFAVQRAQD